MLKIKMQAGTTNVKEETDYYNSLPAPIYLPSYQKPYNFPYAGVSFPRTANPVYLPKNVSG